MSCQRVRILLATLQSDSKKILHMLHRLIFTMFEDTSKTSQKKKHYLEIQVYFFYIIVVCFLSGYRVNSAVNVILGPIRMSKWNMGAYLVCVYVFLSDAAIFFILCCSMLTFHELIFSKMLYDCMYPIMHQMDIISKII